MKIKDKPAFLFETLFNDSIYLAPDIKNNMKNMVMSLKDKMLLRKQSVIEGINDKLKNRCHIEYSRHLARLISKLTS